MKRLYKNIYLLALLATLILLGGGATFILNKLLHLDSYKEQILAEVQQALNRQVIYETGAFSFRFVPQFIFTRVVVKEKGGTATFISADRLTFKLALLPLLEKKVVLSDIELEKPVIAISRDQAGVFNFSDILATKKEKTEEIPLQIRGIRIRKGEIQFMDMAVSARGLATILKETDLSISHLGWGKQSAFKLATTIYQEGKRGSLTLAGSAKVPTKDKPFSDTVLNADISTKKLDASPFWPYYSRYVPFRRIQGWLDMESTFKGKLTEFSSKGKVRITGLRFDYPQVFHAVLTPREMGFSYEMELNPVDITVKSLNLTVDGLNVKGSCAIRDINTSDLRITAKARTSTFNLENFARYIPYGIIVKDTADYIEQHIKGGIYRLDDGRLDGRVSQIAHMERGNNYNVLFINGRVEKGLVTYGPNVPTFNNIKGILEMRGKDFNLIKMSGNFGGSPLTLDGKITDYPLTNPCNYPFTASITPRQAELAWLLGKGARLGFIGESTLHLAGAGPTSNYNLSGDWNLTPTAYSYPDLINKPAGRPNTLAFKGNITRQEMKVSSLQFHLAPMLLNIGASYRFADTGHLAMDIKTNQFQVNEVAAMLPSVNKYQAAGKLQATVTGEGGGHDSTDFRWGGNILLAGFSFRPSEAIKTVNNVNGVITFNGDTVESSQLVARLGNSTIHGRGKLTGFSNPAFSLVFSSPSLDPADFGLQTPQKEVRLTKVQGNISLQDHNLQIKSFTTQLNRSVVNLKGTVQNLDNPNIDLSVTSPYLEVEDLILAGSLERIKKKGTQPSPLTLKAAFQVDAGKVRGIDFEKLLSTVTYENNILYLQPLECSALDGKIIGSARIDFGLSGAPRYQLSYHLNGVSAAGFMQAAGVKKQEITGKMTLQGELTAKGKTAEELKKTALGSAKFHFEEGMLRKFTVLSKIFSRLNFSQLLKFQLPDMVSGGMPYNKLTATLSIKDGIVSSNDIYVASDALNISAVGKADLVKNELDATIGVKPLQTVDKVLSHIPIVGWILTGKNKSLITAYFEAKGKLDDPQVKAIPVQTMAKGVFNIFKRVFQLPATLFTNTGDVIINK
ncbi:MAG TPA: AsmA-like C-terminal domain-containing protein [Geobacteraceae bacterium]|nr:AsmA-like C-terminal domain-containing protein [Geobacteraceae bacterium]